MGDQVVSGFSFASDFHRAKESKTEANPDYNLCSIENCLIRLYFQPLVSLTLFIDSELVTCLLIVTCLFQDEFEDETAKSLAVCLNFCLIDELMTPCISKDRLTLLLYIRLTI